MHIFLFIFYFVALSWILTRRHFFSNIHPRMLIAFFALRVAAGCLHNWVAYKYYPGHGDIWRFFYGSFEQRHLLFTDLHAFWVSNWNGHFSSFSYLQHNIVEWTHLLFNYLSFDNFYINTLFFSFLTLGGHIALFRVFYERFGHNALCAACMLLLPSILFWTSCIHTEGIIYAVLGWLFYTMHRSFRTGWTLARTTGVLLLTALTILFRPAIAIGLLPALALWTTAERRLSRRTILITAAAFILLVAVFSWLYPDSLTLIPRTLSARQQEYQSLEGNSRIALSPLPPSWKGLWDLLPEALLNGLFQPLPGAGGQKVYFFFSLELLFIWIIIIIALATSLIRYSRRHARPAPPSSSPYPSSPNSSTPSSPLPAPLSATPSSTSSPHSSVPSSPLPAPLSTTTSSTSSPHSSVPSSASSPIPALHSSFALPSSHPSGPLPSTGSSAPSPSSPAFTLACLLLAFTGILLIGYIIPFVGAIVRYRSIYLPFLLAPFLAIFRSYPLYPKLNKWLSTHIFK